MVEILVRVKSVPAVSDNVAQLMSSLPVTVKLIGVDDDVAAERASVTVGGVVSGSVVVVVDGATVVVVVDGATVVVGVVAVGGATVVVVDGVTTIGSANHLIGEFSHQHRPVTGQRITPVSLSAQPSISLLLRGRARRVPFIGHVLTYAAVISRLLILMQNFGGTPRVDQTNLYSAPKTHLLSMLFLNTDVLLLTQTETTCGCFVLLCDADATPLKSLNRSPIVMAAVQQRRKNSTRNDSATDGGYPLMSCASTTRIPAV